MADTYQWNTLPTGTTPKDAGLTTYKSSTNEYLYHTYPNGVTVWTLTPINPDRGTITYPKQNTLSQYKSITPQAALTASSNPSGTGVFTNGAGTITQPDWAVFAASRGLPMSDVLKNQSGQPLKLTQTVGPAGKLDTTGTTIWNAFRALTVQDGKTAPKAVELISRWFADVTGNNDVYGIIKTNLTGDPKNITTENTKSLNAILNGVVTVMNNPAVGGNLGNISTGALTVKLKGGAGGGITVVPTPASGNNPALLGQSNASGSTQINAFTTIESELQSWGMDSGPLVNRLKKLVFTTGNHVVSTGQLNDWLKSQPEYEAAFPGLAKYNDTAAKSGQKPINENQYLGLQNSYTQTARNFDLPQGFLTSATIAKLIEGGVSAKEFEDRVMLGYEAAKKADPATKLALKQNYGLSDGDLAAFFLNPKIAENVVTQRMASATIQGYGSNVGLNLNKNQSETLAGMIKTNSPSSSVTGMNNPYSLQSIGTIESAERGAANRVDLTQTQVGANQSTVSTDQLLGAQLPGYAGENQAADQMSVTRAAQERTASFEKGGGYNETAKGVTGLGAART
jgi:hypothetical protein